MGWAKPGSARPIRPIGRNCNGYPWAEYKTKRKLSKLLSQ
ncbi:unnamed protein product, partial [Rotaria sp. Silwood2]